MLEPLTIGLDVGWAFRRDFDPKLQAFFLGDVYEKVCEFFGQACESKRSGLDLHMPRLDLREVEDVIDERQQIVAGRLYRLRVAHLLRAQLAVVIVGEELCEDQQRIQRCPELVRHVRQKVGLVLARLFELFGSEPNDLVHALQIVPLVLELLGLLLELGICLLEFGLLEFEARLRLLQRPTLLFEFLVRYSQFFSLGLKLFGLALGLFEEFLQLRAKVCGTNGDADAVRHLFEKRKRVFLERVNKPKLQYGVRRSVDDCRRNYQMPWLAFPEG